MYTGWMRVSDLSRSEIRLYLLERYEDGEKVEYREAIELLTFKRLDGETVYASEARRWGRSVRESIKRFMGSPPIIIAFYRRDYYGNEFVKYVMSMEGFMEEAVMEVIDRDGEGLSKLIEEVDEVINESGYDADEMARRGVKYIELEDGDVLLSNGLVGRLHRRHKVVLVIGG